jgi:hypothetical protein
MEQAFQLKHFGGFSLLEIATMTAEERKWFLERIAQERAKEAEAFKKASPGASHKHAPPR